MGGKSTSKSAVLGGNGQPSNLYDVRSWQGLTEILRLGKENLSDTHRYAEFRNLVLEYAQKGGDEELQIKIEGFIQSFKTDKTSLENLPTKVVESHEATNNIVDDAVIPNVSHAESRLQKSKSIVPPRRNIPSFLPKTITFEDVANVPDDAQYNNKESTIVADDLNEKFSPVIEPSSIIDPPIGSSDENISDATVHDETVVPPIVSSLTQPIIPPKAEVSLSDSVPEHIPYKSMEEHKARITEIKRLVHDRVGNPATLIDTHNNTGKKYMMALLTALKATGAGSNVSIESAMYALEEAYKNLFNDVAVVTNSGSNLERREDVDVRKGVIQADAPDSDLVSSESITVSSSAEQNTPVAQGIPVTRVEAIDDELPVPVVDQDEIFAPPQVFSSQESAVIVKSMNDPPSAVRNTDLPNLVKREQPNVARVKEIPVPVPIMQASPRSSQKVNDTPLPQKQRERIPVPNYADDSFTGIPAPERKVTQQTSLPVQQSELATPEINDALNGLLQEWPLFSGSGFLGIGPSGNEHPLYIKLATLSMGEILSGRWEKVDTKVVKIIKEYVDAWRHEQGIAYTMNETFEHYLRRVVSRILKRQKD